MEQGPHYHQQTRIAASDNVRNGLARVLNLSLLRGAQRELRFQLIRCNQNLFVSDMYVVQRVFCMMAIL
ncbi:Uncharacterised protein [Enterobacter cloacae]|uniref:Uncharacterized protein n=1 Tax=Enterobacter cloacae TaxID=550 RepID=A0A377LVK4_ENTCL|nr:Uncharacterised protein [Enterobacter cloacae]